MQKPEKNTQPFTQIITGSIVTTTVIAAILVLTGIFPWHEKTKFEIFGIIWPAIFCIVFGGHWLELFFVNYLKFVLPQNIFLLYIVRIGYWFLCSIPLFLLASFVIQLLTNDQKQLGHWWAFGFLYIGIEMLMYGIMQVRSKKSFYNGVY